MSKKTMGIKNLRRLYEELRDIQSKAKELHEKGCSLTTALLEYKGGTRSWNNIRRINGVLFMVDYAIHIELGRSQYKKIAKEKGDEFGTDIDMSSILADFSQITSGRDDRL